jgi:uncharacterized protein (DUF1330 family)
MSKIRNMIGAVVLVLVAGAGWSFARAAAGTPKGYVVAEITVTDPVAYKQYADVVLPIVTRFGGTYIVRGGQTVAVEGDPVAGRVVMIEFKSLAAASTFENSPEYQAVAPIRQRAARSKIFLVEGTQP